MGHLNQRQIAAHIKWIREAKGYSQEDVAKALEIPRTAVSHMEQGIRGISGLELARLAHLFDVSADFLLNMEKEPEVHLERGPVMKKSVSKAELRISVPALKKDRFKQVLLYILERCGAKPNLGETVLYKLLYFADFNFYELYEEHLTGATYRKLPQGPAPLEFQKIVKEMLLQKELVAEPSIYHGYPQKRYLPLIKADLTKLKASEKQVLDQVIDRLSDMNATTISDYSHEDTPWKVAAPKDILDYEMVFYRTPAYSVRIYSDEE